MATVADYMTRKLVTFTPEMDIHRAIKLLLKRRISGGPVLDPDGTLVGVLSKRDCLRVAFSAGYHHEHAGLVREYMTTAVETIPDDTDIVRAAELFINGPRRRFPVMRANRLVGQISRHDVLRALEELW